MKKGLVFICLIIILFLVGCKKDNLETLSKVPNYFLFPSETQDNLEFPDVITIDGKEISLTWVTSDNSVISNQGSVKPREFNQDVLISVKAKIGNDEKTFDLYTITVLGQERKTYTIEYDLSGGVCDNLIHTYKEGDIVNLPSPTKDGYIFLGWYQGNENITSIVSGNYSLVAKWNEEVQNLLISFDDEVIYVGTESRVFIEGYNNLQAFTITSSDESVAYVDSDFYLIGLKKGKTVITFQLISDPQVFGSVEVEVLNRPPYLYRDNKPLIIGDTFTVNISRYDDESLFSVSYDEEYLSYNDGLYTALKEGTTEIKYTLKSDATTYGTLSVTIYPIKPVLSISSSEMTIGGTTRIDVLNYDDDEKINITVSSDLATLNGHLITAIKRGDITITVSLKSNEEIKSSVSVHVKPVLPRIVLMESSIIVGSKSYLFFDNLEEMDDPNIDNYELQLSNDETVKLDDFTFEGLKKGTVDITLVNKYDSELVAMVSLEVIDIPSVYDDENEINAGTLYIYHKGKDDFDGYIHAGDMDYFEITGAHDLTKYEWITSNTRALVIFEDGRYIAVGKGEATILVVRKTNKEVVGKINVRIYGEPDVDYISRLIAIASSQLGYVEGPDNDTKYGTWYGIPNGEWCAMFVSWCANQAGISTEIIPKYASCSAGREWFESRGMFKYKEEYTPKAGDIIFFLSDGAGHTGIVINCIGNRVYTIEGNTSDMCAKRNYDLSWHTITGYGVPNYPPYSGSTTGGDTSGSTEGGGHSTH